MVQNRIQWLWLRDGRCFGYRQGDRLFADDGQQVGRFVGERIFNHDGVYIGVLHARSVHDPESRLVTRLADIGLQHDGFEPAWGEKRVPPHDHAELSLAPGYRAFPTASELKRHILPPAQPKATASDSTGPEPAALESATLESATMPETPAAEEAPAPTAPGSSVAPSAVRRRA
jgi:hypothetical protein